MANVWFYSSLLFSLGDDISLRRESEAENNLKTIMTLILILTTISSSPSARERIHLKSRPPTQMRPIGPKEREPRAGASSETPSAFKALIAALKRGLLLTTEAGRWRATVMMEAV